MNKYIRTIVMLLIVSTLFSCDSRREMSYAEKSSVFEESVGIIQEEEIWSDNYVWVSDTGSIVCQDKKKDYVIVEVHIVFLCVIRF